MYHFSVKIIKRSAGRSSTAAAAYRAGLDIMDERTGELHKYGKRGGVLDHEILTPPRAPEELREAQSLWNAVEEIEKRKDAQLARENVVALHHKLTLEQNRDLLHGFIKEAYVQRGMIAQADIHSPGKDGDQRNIHAHILLTLRRANRNGLSEKKPRNWNSKEVLKEWRSLWAEHMNRALEKAGIEDRVTEKSFQDLGLDTIPSKHMGVEATEMERRGEQSRIGEENKAVKAFNANLDALKQQNNVIDLEIEREKRKEAALERKAQTKEQGRRKEKKEAVRGETRSVSAKGSFADELDRVREKEARQDKEAARKREIFGQQEKNIAEGIKRGFIPPPETEKAQPVRFSDITAQYEKASAPQKPGPNNAEKPRFMDVAAQFEQSSAPESAPPQTTPPEKKQKFSEVARQFEQSSNDNAPGTKTPQQEQPEKSRDFGGYER